MKAIVLKELNAFFTSNMGFVVFILFLISIGSLLWIFPNPFNLFDQGYANLIPFFEVLPWIFCVFIPAICMQSFSEEQKQGTLELLLTKPIPLNHLIAGKFLGSLGLGILALLPTLFYLISLSQLAADDVNVDYGVILSSYLGVMLLMSSFSAIGIFASSLTDNQLIAFFTAAFLSILLYVGLGEISSFVFGDTQLYTLDYFSLKYHFKSISRGVMDSRNILFILSICILFLVLTRLRLNLYLK